MGVIGAGKSILSVTFFIAWVRGKYAELCSGFIFVFAGRDWKWVWWLQIPGFSKNPGILSCVCSKTILTQAKTILTQAKTILTQAKTILMNLHIV
jgi:hypothetical protein